MMNCLQNIQDSINKKSTNKNPTGMVKPVGFFVCCILLKKSVFVLDCVEFSRGNGKKYGKTLTESCKKTTM